MTPAELARVRRHLVAFAAEELGSLPRADQDTGAALASASNWLLLSARRR